MLSGGGCFAAEGAFSCPRPALSAAIARNRGIAESSEGGCCRRVCVSGEEVEGVHTSMKVMAELLPLPR